MFAKVDLKIIEKEGDDDCKDTQPSTPMPEVTPSLLNKYLDVYGVDIQLSWANSLKSSKHSANNVLFDARPRFYDQIIPLFGQLGVKNGTIFRAIRLIETVLSHPDNRQLADGLKKCDVSSGERLTHHFRWWFFEVALPCLVIACEQTEVGVDWRVRVIKACWTLGIPCDPSVVDSHVFRVYLTFEDRLYDLTYGDMTTNVFSKLSMNPIDASVIRDLTEKLLIQQLMFDEEFSGQVTCEEMIHAAVLLMLERLEMYLEGIHNEMVSSPHLQESLKQLRQSLRSFPRKRTGEVVSRLAHIRNNVDAINELAEENGGALANLRTMIYE